MASNTEMRPPAGRRQLQAATGTMDRRQRRSLAGELTRCLVFAGELLLFGLFGSLVGLVVVVANDRAPGTQEKFGVNLTAMEAVVLVSERRPVSPAYSVLVYNAWIVAYAPVAVTPSMFALVIKSSRVQITAVVASAWAGLASFCYVIIAPGVPEFMATIFIQAPFFAVVPTLAAFYPRKSRLWCLGMLLLVACGAGQYLALTVANLEAADKQLLLTCVIIPAAREIGVMPMRLLARLLDNMDPNSTGITVRRNLTWGFALVFQITFSIASRLLTASIEGPQKALSIILQAVLEIALRLTMTQRDKLVARAVGVRDRTTRVLASMTSAGSPARSAIYANPSAKVVSQPQLDGGNRRRTDASLMNAEMLSEYVAIMFQMACLLVLRDAPMALSMQAFADMKAPFNEPLPISGIITGTVGMLVAEIIVDTVCSVVEHRQAGPGLDLPRAWHTINFPRKMLMIAMASLAGAGTAMLVIVASRNIEACAERNICLCASGRGLRPRTLAQTYCAEMYPPSGRPGGVHIYFALETPSRIEWPRRRLDKELLANDGSLPLPLHLLGDMEVDLSSSGDDLTSATRALIGTYTSGETPTLAVAVSERAAPGGSLSGRPCDGETLSVLALPSLNGTALRAQVSLWLNLSACDLDDCEAWVLDTWSCRHPANNSTLEPGLY